MEVKLNNVEIKNLYESIIEFQNNNDLLITLSMKLTKIVKEIDSHYQDYIEKLRELRQKYGKKDDEGNLIIKENKIDFEKDDFEKFIKETKGADNLEVEIKFPVHLKLKDFVDETGKPLKLNAKFSYAIEPIIEM